MKTELNYLIIKTDKTYKVEEREIFNISDIQGKYLTSTTHRDDAYNAVNTLNYLISKSNF